MYSALALMPNPSSYTQAWRLEISPCSGPTKLPILPKLFKVWNHVQVSKYSKTDFASLWTWRNVFTLWRCHTISISRRSLEMIWISLVCFILSPVQRFTFLGKVWFLIFFNKVAFMKYLAVWLLSVSTNTLFTHLFDSYSVQQVPLASGKASP